MSEGQEGQRAVRAVIEGGPGEGPPRDAVTGAPVAPPEGKARNMALEEIQWMRSVEADFWEEKGEFEHAAKLRGKPFEPTVGLRMSQAGALLKDAFVKVTIVVVPGFIALWIGDQLLRFFAPSLRTKLPAWGIHYEDEMAPRSRR